LQTSNTMIERPKMIPISYKAGGIVALNIIVQ
jgi:hypothetical protein